MADDIVTRPRDYSARGAVFATNDMCWEAADEIERLRTAGDALAEALHGWCNGMDAFTDDSERLRVWQEARRG